MSGNELAQANVHALAGALPLNDWRGDCTRFDGFYETRPDDEHRALPWAVLCEALAPTTGPRLSTKKENSKYFVPCLLREAPLTGKTLEKAHAACEPTIGKQRSSGHTTVANFLAFDIDGLTKEEWQSLLGMLKEGLAHLTYSTWSHGSVDKPGVRARVIIPVDDALSDRGYQAVWQAVNQAVFAGRADATSSRLYQAQGVWTAHPSRRDAAFRVMQDGAVLSVAKLLGLALDGPVASKARAVSNERNGQFDSDIESLGPFYNFHVTDLDRLRRASVFWNPDDYSQWISNITCLKSIAAVLDGAELRGLVIEYSARARPESQVRNEHSCYSPGAIFDQTAPYLEPGVAFATLLARARDGAIPLIKADRGKEQWSDGQGQHHPSADAG